jgi:flagellar biosynthesis protein FlhF
MKITRHTGPDIRHALRAVRDSLGADAVILATRRTANGVEITAAMDFDADTVVESATPSAAPSADASFTPLPLPEVPFLPAVVAESVECEAPAEEAITLPAAAAAELPPDSPRIPTLDAGNDEMTSELKTLRRMLETQLAQLAWRDLTSRAPLHTEMLREMTEIGIDQGIAAEIVASLPGNCDITTARRHLGAALGQRVTVTGDQWLEAGGRIALIGPTGVGKTSVLAKLAVRWALRHGSRDLALIAGDSVRIGAQDQVRALGQLLGVPVFALDTLEQLPGVLARLGRFRMVLIDTPGAGQRDASLTQRLLQLSRVAGEVQTTLVLAASTQAGAIEEAVRRFSPAAPASCVLTKVDEAVTLGGVLSVLIRARLPIAYVSEGQRVPEDLRPARSTELIATAIQLAQTNGATADEDLLKRRFGDVAHALA